MIGYQYDINHKMNQTRMKEEVVSENEQDDNSDLDSDVESALNALFLSPITLNPNLDNQSDISTPTQFDDCVKTPSSSSNFDSDSMNRMMVA